MFFFRKNSAAVVCDITEVYLQVEIAPKDRPYFRFLWRDMDGSRVPDVYEFSRIVLGVNFTIPCSACYPGTC